MANRFKIILALFGSAVFILSCGAQGQHAKNFSLVPSHLVQKSEETQNNMVIFSFDVKTMRETVKVTSRQPKVVAEQIGLVLSKAPSGKDYPPSLDPMKMEGFAICPQYDFQAMTNTEGLADFLSKNGYISEEDGKLKTYSRKYMPGETVELPPYQLVSGNGAIQVTTENKSVADYAKYLLDGEDDPVTGYSAVQEVVASLEDFPAIALIFPFESFAGKQDTRLIVSGLRPDELSEMAGSYKSWGRPDRIKMMGVGSKVEGLTETVKIVFLYKDEEAAEGDLEDLKNACLNARSVIDGTPWAAKMGLGRAVVTRDGKIIEATFPLDRGGRSGYRFPQALDVAFRIGDYGVFWKK